MAQEIEFLEEEGSEFKENAVEKSFFYGNFLTSLSFDTALECVKEDASEFFARFELGLKHNPSNNFSINLSGRFTYWAGIEAEEGKRFFLFNGKNFKPEFESELWEAYLHYTYSNISLTFGNQFLRWGQTTIFNPLNQINPVDYRYGLFLTDETLYLPVFAGDLNVALKPFVIEGVLVPFFLPNKFMLYGRDYSLHSAKMQNLPINSLLSLLMEFIHPSIEDKIQPYILSTEAVEENFFNFSGGLRVLYGNKKIKTGISYFYGWDRTPYAEIQKELAIIFSKFIEAGFDMKKIIEIVTSSEVQTTIKKLEQKEGKIGDLYKSKYKRLHSFGFEASLNFDPIFFHIESAFQPQRTLYTEEFSPLRKPMLTTDYAIEYNYETLFDITIELSHVHIFDLKKTNLLLLKEDLFTLGGILNFRPLKFEKLSLKLIFIYGITLSDLILSPMVTYKVRENWHISTGGHFLEGSEKSLGYLFDRNDQLFIHSELYF